MKLSHDSDLSLQMLQISFKDSYIYGKMLIMKDQKSFKSIHEVRHAIDQIDFKILKLLGERNYCTGEVVKFKKDREEVIANDRQKEVLDLRRQWAEEFGLDPGLVEQIYKLIIESNIKKQLEILEKRNSK